MTLNRILKEIQSKNQEKVPEQLQLLYDQITELRKRTQETGEPIKVFQEMGEIYFNWIDKGYATKKTAIFPSILENVANALDSFEKQLPPLPVRERMQNFGLFFQVGKQAFQVCISREDLPNWIKTVQDLSKTAKEKVERHTQLIYEIEKHLSLELIQDPLLEDINAYRTTGRIKIPQIEWGQLVYHVAEVSYDPEKKKLRVAKKTQRGLSLERTEEEYFQSGLIIAHGTLYHAEDYPLRETVLHLLVEKYKKGLDGRID